MDDPRVIAGAVLAVAALVALAWRFGVPAARIGDVAEAGARFVEDFPDDEVVSGVLDREGRAALLELAEGTRVGLVMAFGDRFVTRRLGARDLRAARAGGGVLLLRLDDPVLPAVALELGEEAAEHWRRRLESEIIGA